MQKLHPAKRRLVWHGVFDTRANTLATKIGENWDQDVKELWKTNKEKVIFEVLSEFGIWNSERKILDFVALGTSPFSVVAHHNKFFAQIRAAFTQGAYYPALTGACALGERILNHLVIDLRDNFKSTPEYKTVYRKKSFDDWSKAVDVLTAWKVLEKNVATLFKKLEVQRQRSIHFNLKIVSNLRDESLASIQLLRDIIAQQFSGYEGQSWVIPGTRGHRFFKKEYEGDPFLECYFFPQSPLVGINFAMRFDPNAGWIFYDYDDYGSKSLSDEEFRDQFNDRNHSQLTPTEEKYRISK